MCLSMAFCSHISSLLSGSLLAYSIDAPSYERISTWQPKHGLCKHMVTIESMFLKLFCQKPY